MPKFKLLDSFIYYVNNNSKRRFYIPLVALLEVFCLVYNENEYSRAYSYYTGVVDTFYIL